MPDLLLVLSLAIEVAFGLLAIRTILAWFREPDVRHFYLSVALGSLAALILISPLFTGSGPGGAVATDAGVVLFLVSGYGLLMFRDTFVPLQPRARWLAIVAIVLAGVLGIAAQLPSSPEAPHSPFQSAVLAGVVAVWAFCILEPIARLWLASRGRPAEATQADSLTSSWVRSG